MNIEFVLPEVNTSIIKVVGVGGGGCNAVNYMYQKGITDVSFVVCNTDDQALTDSPVPIRIQLGRNTTCGLGAGSDPEKAKKAAEESIEEIKNVLSDNTKMVFITAGMGGGTGTGAAPVVARVAKELGILTVGIVTIPFAFEGKQKIKQAFNGIREMRHHVDALLIINNEKLREVHPDLKLSNAFSKADDVLTQAAKGIAEIITIKGHINVDFADVNTTMRNGGVAVMNSGYAEGENRITNAINDAINSPLLNNRNIHDSKRILINFYSSTENEIGIEEVDEINAFMAKMGDDIEVIWGITFDDTLGNGVKVTLIATGFSNDIFTDEPENNGNFDKNEATKVDTAESDNEWMKILYPENNEEKTTLEELDNDELFRQMCDIPAFERNKKQ